MTALATNFDFSVSRQPSVFGQKYSNGTNGTEPWKEKTLQSRRGQVDTPINLQPQLTGRKTVFENHRILRYLRIAESGLTHQTRRIEVSRGVHVVTAWPIITDKDYSIRPRRDDVAPVPTAVRRELSEGYREMLSYKELEDGWDDMSSQAISAEVIDTALAFFRCLPSEILEPEASASGDGTVDWYWRSGGSYTALVTFYPDSLVAYSAMTGSGSDKGRFKFSGSIPDGLIESLKQL